MDKIKVLIADDHRLFRDGLRTLLLLEGDIEVVGEAKDGLETLDMVRATNPDIVLFDINMPKMDGGRGAKELINERCRSKFIVITAQDDEKNLEVLSTAGIRGYIHKSSGISDLLFALHSVYDGELYVDPKVAGKLLNAFQKREVEENVLDNLTQREKEVFYWLSQGFPNTEISDKMSVSEKAIKNHVSSLLKKLDLNNRTQVAVMAWRTGLIQKVAVARQYHLSRSAVSVHTSI